VLLDGNHDETSTKLDILIHKSPIHAEEANGDIIADKLVFNVDTGVTDDRTDAGRSCRVDMIIVEKA
jgi:hypothetical protein